MKKIFVLILFISLYLSAFEVTSIQLSDSAIEHPEEDRVELGAVTDRFPVGTPVIHALVHLRDTGGYNPTTIRWIAEDALPQSDEVIGEAEGVIDPNASYFHVYYSQGAKILPPGHYRLEILSQGKLVAKKRFSLYPPKGGQKEREISGNHEERFPIYLAKSIQEYPDGSITPIDVSEHFPNSQHQIYAIVPFENIKPGTPYSIEWLIVYDGINRDKSLYQMQGKFMRSKGSLTSDIELPRDWPDGIFKVVLRVNGKRVAEKRFTIGNIDKLSEKEKTNAPAAIPDAKTRRKMIRDLASWMLETIHTKDLKPLYEHSLHSWRERNDWKALKRSFRGIFNAKLNWDEIFAQTPTLRPIQKLPNGAIKLQAVYPGIRSVDVLLEGTFYPEEGEWRLLGFALEPVRQ